MPWEHRSWCKQTLPQLFLDDGINKRIMLKMSKRNKNLSHSVTLKNPTPIEFLNWGHRRIFLLLFLR